MLSEKLRTQENSLLLGDDELERSLAEKEKRGAIRGLHEAVHESHKIARQKKPLDENLIKYLHYKILGHISFEAGSYRRNDATITNASFTPSSWEKIPDKMAGYTQELGERLHQVNFSNIPEVVNLAAWAHFEFVRIHPFCDGNGILARIISNVVLERFDLYPVDEWVDDHWYETKREDYTSALGKVANLREFKKENGFSERNDLYLEPLKKYLARVMTVKYRTVEKAFKKYPSTNMLVKKTQEIKNQLKPLT